jgi:hypothetical protein
LHDLVTVARLLAEQDQDAGAHIAALRTRTSTEERPGEAAAHSAQRAEAERVSPERIATKRVSTLPVPSPSAPVATSTSRLLKEIRVLVPHVPLLRRYNTDRLRYSNDISVPIGPSMMPPVGDRDPLP